MRPLIALMILAFLASACQPESSSELSTLTTKRDSLKSLRTEITAELVAIEDRIQELDTTKVKRITNVTTLEVKPQRFEHFFTVQGVVETDQNAQIFPEAAGRVVSIPVEEGQRVSKGQVLMRLDNAVVSQQIQELKSRLELAKTVYQKQEKLWEQKIGSEIQFLEAKNNYEALQSNLETLSAQSELYVITAPFAGVVDEIHLKEGEMAAPQMPAFRLINNDHMYLKADLTERYLSQIKAGDSVEVSFPSIGKSERTTISRVGSFINPNNRTFKIRLDLPNTGKDLKPNLLGELKVRDYKNDSVMVIPSSLVQMTPAGDEFVFVLRDNKAKKVDIQTGKSYNDQVEVLSGLHSNDILIEKGARSIKDGDTVQIIETQPTPSEATAEQS